MQDYLIVHKSIVPDYFQKIIEINNAIATKKYPNISTACKALNISRSTYYKYKDYIYTFEESTSIRKAVIALELAHQSGALSNVLNILNNHKASILTISQALPVHDKASILVSLDIINLNVTIDELMENLRNLDVVKRAALLSIE